MATGSSSVLVAAKMNVVCYGLLIMLISVFEPARRAGLKIR
ncbi:MAG: hypothetical protein ACJ79Y_13620 [Myxococcales bacterium]